MAEKLIVVRVSYDPEAKVWCTESSDLFGLNACASRLDEFRTILPGMIQDLLETGTAPAIEIVVKVRDRATASNFVS